MDRALGLEYEEQGSGEAVLLIHGGVIADAFLPLSRQPVLAQQYRVIRYRRPGYGGSDFPAMPFSVADQAKAALTLLLHLGVERAHVVGHSYGGAVAVHLALDAARVVHSLVLLEPAVFTREEAAPVRWIQPLTEVYRSDAARAVDLFMTGAGGPDWRTQIGASIPGAPEQAEKDAAAVFELELPSLLERTFGADDAGRIAQPVVYMTGGASLPQGRDVTRMLAPGAEEVVIAGVNHSLAMVEPGRVAKAIAEFLNRNPMV